MLYNLVLVVHVLIAIGLVVMVLLQQGKGADAGAAFGSGASGTVFGAAGAANFLTRTTAVLATLFFITSLALFTLAKDLNSSTSVVDQPAAQAPVESTVPAAKEEPKPAAPSDVPVSE